MILIYCAMDYKTAWPRYSNPKYYIYKKVCCILHQMKSRVSPRAPANPAQLHSHPEHVGPEPNQTRTNKRPGLEPHFVEAEKFKKCCLIN